jgi:hypothetical protein
VNAVSEWLERHRDELRYEGSENGCDVYTFVGYHEPTGEPDLQVK